MLLAISWITFHSINEKFSNEKIFLFIFIHIFFLAYVFPLVLLGAITDTMGEKTPTLFQETFVNFLLAKPLVILLDLLGYLVWSDGITISYIDTTTNLSSKVAIATGCSGLYSVLIFTCAFFSYILAFANLSFKESFLFFMIGVTMSYFANLLRMAFIILAGHYFGSDALEFTHANIGWIIFTFWFFIFWSLFNKYLIFIKNDRIFFK